MKLKELDNLLDQTPVVYTGNLLPLVYLNNIKVIYDIKKFKIALDLPNISEKGRFILIDNNNELNNRFPIITLDEDVFKVEFNELLYDKYDFINNYAFSQNNIAEYITSNSNCDLIILLMIDGLSFIDCKYIKNVLPCFVNGATITEVGFRNVINDPPICFRLYEKGFKNRFGFSYWYRNNEITDTIFKGFTQQQMFRVSEFDAIIEELSKRQLYKSYIQIVINGCDQIAHDNRERPIINHIIDRIFNDYIIKLINLCKNKNLKSNIYLISDHGIWWKPKIYDNIDIKQISYPSATKNRILIGTFENSCAKNITCYNTNYSLLRYPFIFKNFAINQWGVHGGLSIYESFVPFFKLDVVI